MWLALVELFTPSTADHSCLVDSTFLVINFTCADISQTGQGWGYVLPQTPASSRTHAVLFDCTTLCCLMFLASAPPSATTSPDEIFVATTVYF
ncbi:hypothetical protein RRG08_026415 [Elysia crispata]|uniref:Uncharacterized protein n=1 Tax=Elysia crispata TaxID=231223 RepID=A0AAE0XMX1_9GAST|nr:hypothetical protein RRG08_026415 [Elysia crispata]